MPRRSDRATSPSAGARYLTVVRHARAGSKKGWDGPDLVRPLDEVGRQHAAALAALLAEQPVGRLVSSPTLRCIETLQPLSATLDLPIERSDDLGPDGVGLSAYLADPSFADAVLCTHGELMSPLLGGLNLRRVTAPRGRPRRRELMSKGSAWRLTLSPGGRVLELAHVRPPR